eukprot:5406359-Pleurochrysis_carterae.AAC.3
MTTRLAGGWGVGGSFVTSLSLGSSAGGPLTMSIITCERSSTRRAHLHEDANDHDHKDDDG